MKLLMDAVYLIKLTKAGLKDFVANKDTISIPRVVKKEVVDGDDKMKVRSMRIPEDIEQAIEYVSRAEKVEKTQSLRKLARVGFESYVARAYKEGKVTLQEVSSLLKLSLSETIDLLADMGVTGNIRARDVLANLNALDPW